MKEENVAIADLMADPRLRPQELASRLYYLYCEDCKHPLPSLVQTGDPAPEDLLQPLRRYRKYANMVYDVTSEHLLAELLDDDGVLGDCLVCGMLGWGRRRGGVE